MILLNYSKKRDCYYKVNIYPTLFGDYLVQKEYGFINSSKPINVIKSYADTNKEALLLMLDIAVSKKSLGYLKAS